MANMYLGGPDCVVLIGYFALVLLIGLYFRRRQKTAGDFFAGGHQVPWWLAGISHYMSGFSAFTFVVYSEVAYRYGGVAIVFFWTSVSPACLAATCLPRAGAEPASSPPSNSSSSARAFSSVSSSPGPPFLPRSSKMPSRS